MATAGVGWGWARKVATAAVLFVLALAILERLLGQRVEIAPDERVVYKRIDGHPLALDVFHARARDTAGPPAALLLFHGGAWERGSAAQFHPQCRHFSRLGLTCISAQYRVRGEHGTGPAESLQDARDAMRYLRARATSLRIDASRIAAAGGSAGGHLAAALGVDVSLVDPAADPAVPVRPDLLVLFNPMLDLSPGRPDHERAGPDWHQVSPRHHVKPGVPPTLILNGTADAEVPLPTVQEFCAAVLETGGQCRVEVFDGGQHGFFNPGAQGGRYYDRVNVSVDTFLREHGFLR
jgi:acetyl esterase/lipase